MASSQPPPPAAVGVGIRMAFSVTQPAPSDGEQRPAPERTHAFECMTPLEAVPPRVRVCVRVFVFVCVTGSAGSVRRVAQFQPNPLPTTHNPQSKIRTGHGPAAGLAALRPGLLRLLGPARRRAPAPLAGGGGLRGASGGGGGACVRMCVVFWAGSEKESIFDACG